MDFGDEGAVVPPPAVTVDLDGGDTVSDLTGKVHRLPCCIKYNGPTAVSHYFKPKPAVVELDGLAVEEAYFRGRNLFGTTIDLPQGYSGFILVKDSDERTSDHWETTAKFRNLSVWNHDARPTKDDAIIRAFHWFAVAETLHQPLSAEDLDMG